MGKSYTPTYYARYRDQSGWKDIAWDGKRNGRATIENAEKYRQSLNRSFNIGGVNFHASQACGYIIHVSELQVVRNDRSSRIVAQAVMNDFEVI